MKPLLILLTFFICYMGKAQNISESELIYYFSQNNYGLNSTFVQQIGNNNYAQIEANQATITQTGDNQQFYYSESSILPSNVNVNVEGHNSYVEIIGNNEILNNMTINIQGDNRNVIIRNYP